MAAPQPGVWGIDLGQCALKAVRLEMIDGEVTATAFDYIEHPKILSQPDADPDELTREALQQFLSRNKLKGDVVVVSVPGQSGLARFVKLPPVEEKKIADIVRFEAKQQIPFPLDEVVWDFQKIGSGEVTDGFAMETEIGLFAMKRDMVNRAIQQFKDVNVEVHLIQMAPLALVNFVAYDLLNKDGMAGGPAEEGADSKECVVALDIGTDNSNLVITDGEKIIWQRPIPLGGNHFTRALTKDMKLTFAKAEHLKRNAVKSPDLKKILSSLKQVLNDFVGEVQRSLGYFTNTHRDAQIQYMLGLGNAFRLPGLQKYLQEKLQLEVRKLADLQRVKGENVLAEPAFAENILSFAVATGLALQGLKVSRLQTNLLPHEVKVERLVRAKKPWAAAAAAALLLAVAGLTFGYSMELATVQVDGDRARLLAEADKAAKEAKANQDELTKWRSEKEKSIQVRLRIGAGVKERFNWQLLHQYVNMALPRPNGEKLSRSSRRGEDIYGKYYTPQAKEAYEKLEAKRFAGDNKLGIIPDPKEEAQNEEFIKKHLVQVNIEGITALYTEDVVSFFKNLHKSSEVLQGMDDTEKAIVRKVAKATSDADYQDVKDKIPLRAWAVEIRGYTYHSAEQRFAEDTLLENLAVPEKVGNVPSEKEKELAKEAAKLREQIAELEKPAAEQAKADEAEGEKTTPAKAKSNAGELKKLREALDKLAPVEEKVQHWEKMKAQVRDRVKYMVLFKNDRVLNPEVGAFQFIRMSSLKSLLRPAEGAPKGDPGQQPSSDPNAPAVAKANRDSWRPVGQVAPGTYGEVNLGGGFGGGAFDKGGGFVAGGKEPGVKEAVARQPRTEFVLVFIWSEPLLNEAAEQKKD